MAKRKPRRTVPRQLEIAGHLITVELDDTLGDRGDSFGQFHGQRNLIVIDPRYCDDLVSETLIHEIIEAINMKAELRLEHPQIQTLALLLHQALSTAR